MEIGSFLSFFQMLSPLKLNTHNFKEQVPKNSVVVEFANEDNSRPYE